MELSGQNKTGRRRSLDIKPGELIILIAGITAQLRRMSSSIRRGRSTWKTLQVLSMPRCPTEEYSETFVANDGVLTTNFCSTEL